MGCFLQQNLVRIKLTKIFLHLHLFTFLKIVGMIPH